MLPAFEEDHDIEVLVIPVGTGRALEYGRRGDVDLILVHSPADEIEFVERGYGTRRHCVMYNDFLLVGPALDPAEIKGKTAVNALKRIINSDSTFISRGDDSGTHKKELSLWETAGGEYSLNPGYIETGTGMGKTLLVAGEKEGYTLVDRGTYQSMKDSVDLDIMVEGDDLLTNPYGIIATNPGKHPDVNNEGAQKLITWILSNEAQQMIADFTKDGETLFTPLYGECPPEG
jgi:tungstate transport system substrate-binding protein